MRRPSKLPRKMSRTVSKSISKSQSKNIPSIELADSKMFDDEARNKRAMALIRQETRIKEEMFSNRTATDSCCSGDHDEHQETKAEFVVHRSRKEKREIKEFLDEYYPIYLRRKEKQAKSEQAPQEDDLILQK